MLDKVPMIGFGTYQLSGKSCYDAVVHALKCGYRHIDTASVYGNESIIADAIESVGISRSELFIVSKLQPKDSGVTSVAYQAALDSLSRLRTDYFDLYLIHWPGRAQVSALSPDNPGYRLNSWRALEQLYHQGKAKAIGVSNFLERHLTELLTQCSVPPSVNQVEFHPFLDNRELLAYCTLNSIQVEAYSPLGQADTRLLGHPVIVKIANNQGRTSAQVLLRWCIQQDVIALPRSRNPARIKENLNVFDFKLDDQEMEEIGHLYESNSKRYCWDPNAVL
uniref:NADP-dependent oxidoreductase domain-containing protein n=1 Tax=Spongospora subterranea TaxID=70186 RepID=A0A0H5QGG0_9EUKA|eukprot:CRZ00682.1 hypothetical protein [Spongospora subterranea]